ncbi:MAG TPA: DNA glycosylase [Nitrososphaeraceae archaeon]|nr:DNA glycosylase [Nitrososphaeraceae archaeon]
MPNTPLATSFVDPEISVNSGQMFLWQKIDNSWYGVYGDRILKFSILQQDKNSPYEIGNTQFFSFPEFNKWEQHVFRLDDDITTILSSLSKDLIVSKAMKTYRGLRVTRQEPEQCMISFACSSNTNISMIRRMLGNLCRKFGNRVFVDGREFFTFPTATRLNKVTNNELLSCGVGYRVKAIRAVVENIVSNTIDLEDLKRARYNAAKQQLTRIYGIGNKIADCILLFSLEKTEAFPIDLWITRAICLYYQSLLTRNQEQRKYRKEGIPEMNEKFVYRCKYEILSELMRKYFGEYAGYAQQYLYYYVRQKASRKW